MQLHDDAPAVLLLPGGHVVHWYELGLLYVPAGQTARCPCDRPRTVSRAREVSVRGASGCAAHARDHVLLQVRLVP